MSAGKNLAMAFVAAVFAALLAGCVVFAAKERRVPAFSRGVLLMTFDDRNWERWVKAIPLFGKYGAHASFFPHGPLDARALECMKALHDAGHTVGPHTLHHADATNYFAKAGGERYWLDEVKPQMDMFASVGIVPVAMAYPNNRHSAETDLFLSGKGIRRFRCGQRRHWAPNRGPNPTSHAAVDEAFSPAAEFRSLVAVEAFGVGERYGTDIDDLLLAIDRAAERNEVFAIYSHDIAPGAKSINMKLEWLERILARAKERGVAMLGMAEFPPPAAEGPTKKGEAR